MWGLGVAGPLVERKRRLERETLKEGLRVRLERKVCAIKERKQGVGVGALIWRFSRRLRLSAITERCESLSREEWPKKGRVGNLRRFWESLGGGTNGDAAHIA